MADPAVRLTILGSGTSMGVPLIGCSCRVCTSDDPRNTRRRCAIHLESGGHHLQIDTPPDFRDQVLRFGVKRIDTVLLTHAHADHIFGFDDLRRYGDMSGRAIPVWSDAKTLVEMRQKFPYVREQERVSDALHVPRVRWCELPASESVFGPFRVLPLLVPHGDDSVLGFLINVGGVTIGYFPDCSDLPADVLGRLRGIDLLLLNTLRHHPHPKHLHLDRSLQLLAQVGARETYLTHLSHDFDHAETDASLPSGIHLAHDGLVLEF